MEDGKNKDSGEFDDDVLDDDFSDIEFDESAYDDAAEYDPESTEDDDFGGDDFEVEDWGDESEEAGGKKTKKAKRSGGLSFNAIVIIGAVIVGAGVLVFNVMSETNKAEASKPSIFQSIIGIGGIMDGMLFGDKTEETASTETQSDNQGFLNDPTTPITPPDQNNPPQPTPIAPTDNTAAINEPLMPMPDEVGAPSPEAPRGPEETPPEDNSVAATDPMPPESQQSAEDILKQAMANREQKLQDEAAPENPNIPLPEEQVVETNQSPVDEPPQPVSDAPADQTATIMPVAELPQPVSQPADMPPAVMPEEAKQEITANKEAVSALEGKLDSLLKRMDQIESDLNSVRENKPVSGDTAALEKTVADLKEEISALKSRPAAPVKSQNSTSEESEPAPAPKPAKKKSVRKTTPAQDQPYSPSKQAAKPAGGQWELRAAQPGRAWVSRAGERDMQAVSIGDTLPGIGRIGSITYMNGRWTVAGSQGSIQQ